MPQISSASGEWKRSQTSEGTDYFYHSGTGKVQWEQPSASSSSSSSPTRSNDDDEAVVNRLLPKLEIHAASLERKLNSAKQELDTIKSLIAKLRNRC